MGFRQKFYELRPERVFFRSIYTKIYNKILSDSTQIYTYHDRGMKYFRSKGYKKNIIPLKNTIDTRKTLKILDNYNESEQKKINQKFNQYKYHIIFVGAIHDTKSLENFREIMNLLPKEYALIIVGTGDEKYLEGLKHFLKDDRIYFEGYKNMEQLLYYYRLVDFFILPGLSGLAINQSMAFGVPVLCTYADGIEEEIVIKDETGYIYSSIEDAVSYIQSKNKSDWIDMGENANKLILNTYTTEKMVDRFISGLETVRD